MRRWLTWFADKIRDWIAGAVISTVVGWSGWFASAKLVSNEQAIRIGLAYAVILLALYVLYRWEKWRPNATWNRRHATEQALAGLDWAGWAVLKRFLDSSRNTLDLSMQAPTTGELLRGRILEFVNHDDERKWTNGEELRGMVSLILTPVVRKIVQQWDVNRIPLAPHNRVKQIPERP